MRQRSGRTSSRCSARRGDAVLGGQPHLGFELRADRAGLAIAIWVPGVVPPGLVERAVEAAWPGARTETIPSAPPLPGGGLVTGGELRLAVSECYPLRVEHRVDPLRPLLGALTGAGDEEAACVQLLARPVTGRRLVALQRGATKRRNGRPTSHSAGLLDLLTPGHGSARSASSTTVDPTRGEDVAAILEKAAQPCWAITLRYAVATTETTSAAKARLRGRAHAIAAAFAIFAGRNRFDRHRLRHPIDVLAARRFGRGNLVSIAELAALAHLPTDDAVPGLRRAGARSVAPPPEVAGFTDGAVAVASTPKVLGDAEGGSRRGVVLAVGDARHHLHVMGATGSGKSTLLLQLALGDIVAGRGIVVIDPKGDLITDVLARLPDGAEDRLVLIDPEEHEAPPILNVLSGPDPDLVEDDDAAVVEEECRASAVGVEEELRERVGAQPRLVTQYRRRHRRGREPDRVEAGRDPCFARGVERAGLAGSCRTDEEREALAAGDEPAHRLTLVLAEARAVEHACGNRLRHHRRVRVPAARQARAPRPPAGASHAS